MNNSGQYRPEDRQQEHVRSRQRSEPRFDTRAETRDYDGKFAVRNKREPGPQT